MRKKIAKIFVLSLLGASVLPIAQPAIAATTKTIVIENTKVSVPEKGNKWIYLNGYQHFVKDGKLTKGWKWMTEADGEKTPHYSYFGNDGRMRKGIQKMGTKENPDGDKKTHLSYFGNNGWLQKDCTVKADGKMYKADAHGWLKKESVTVNFNGNGATNYKWIKDSVEIYDKGYMLSGKTYTENYKITADKNYYYKNGYYNKTTGEKAGYLFVGWNTKSDGTGKSYRRYIKDKNGKTIEAEFTTKDFGSKNVTLYPEWLKVEKEWKSNAKNEKKFTPSYDTNASGGLHGKKMVGQGGDVFEKNGKKYLIASFVSSNKNHDKDRHILAIFDYETGKKIKQKNDLHIGHCNGIAYHEGYFYISTTGADECKIVYDKNTTSLLKLDWNLKIVEKIALKNSKGKILDSINAVDFYDGKMYVKKSATIFEFTKQGKEWKMTKQEKSLAQTNPVSDKIPYIYSQGMAVNKNYFYTGFLTDKVNHSFVTKMKRSNNKTSIINFNTGDPEKTPIDELQDFSVIGTKVYIISGGKCEGKRSVVVTEI